MPYCYRNHQLFFQILKLFSGISSNDAGFESISQFNFDFFLTTLYYFQFAYVLFISGGTILLLYHNFKRIGKVMFWVLVILPVLIFLSTTLTIYEEINPTGLVAQATPIDYMIPILLMNYSALAVGVIFGLSFILVGRLSVDEHLFILTND
jgi:hypothetical protein